MNYIETMTKTAPFTVTAMEVYVGEYILIQTFSGEPVIAKVTAMEFAGDDVTITTTYGEQTMSEGTPITALGRSFTLA